MFAQNILIAEDDPIVAHYLKSVLVKSGHNILDIVATGEEAIQVAEEKEPDIILMDIFLEGTMNGLQATREITSRLNVPVIYLTGVDSEKGSQGNLLEEIETSGAVGLIRKPVNLDELLINIRIATFNSKLANRLKASENNFSRLFQNAVVGIYQADERGLFFNVNSTLCAMFGYTDEEEFLKLVVNGRRQFCLEEDYFEFWEKLKEEGELNSVESEVFGRDGDAFWIEEYAKVIYDEQGKISHIEGFIIDITSRKEIEQAYASTHNLLQLTMDCIQDLILVIDMNGNIISYNKSCEENNINDKFSGEIAKYIELYIRYEDNIDMLCMMDTINIAGINYRVSISPFIYEGQGIGYVCILHEVSM